MGRARSARSGHLAPDDPFIGAISLIWPWLRPRGTTTAVKITTTKSLLDALDARGDDPQTRKAFDDAVWAQRGIEAAILVTDLSGFTKQTKIHGILHFLQVFRRCDLACQPIIQDFGGWMMKHEADDLIVMFDDAVSAVRAAMAMQQASVDDNRQRPADDRWRVSIGVEYGPMIRLDDDAFGDAVNVAFKLGEDIAEPGEILIGPEAYGRSMAAGVDFEGFTSPEARSVEIGAVTLDHHAIRRIEKPGDR